jgi:hypothetical protein
MRGSLIKCACDNPTCRKLVERQMTHVLRNRHCYCSKECMYQHRKENQSSWKDREIDIGYGNYSPVAPKECKQQYGILTCLAYPSRVCRI